MKPVFTIMAILILIIGPIVIIAWAWLLNTLVEYFFNRIHDKRNEKLERHGKDKENAD